MQSLKLFQKPLFYWFLKASVSSRTAVAIKLIIMAYLKTDQQRIKELLSETIVLLCKNGLHFEKEFSIEALIAITLDQKDIFLVSIKETVLADSTLADMKINQSDLLPLVSTSASQSVAPGRSGFVLPPLTSSRKRRHPMASLNERANQRMSVYANSAYMEGQKLRKHEQYSELESSYSVHQASDAEEHAAEVHQNVSFSDTGARDDVVDMEKDYSDQGQRHSFKVATDSRNLQDKDLVVVKDEPSVDTDLEADIQQSSTISAQNMELVPGLGNAKPEIGEVVFHDVVQSQVASYSSWTYQRNSGGLDGMNESSLRRVVWHPALPSLIGQVAGEGNLDHVSCSIRPHPNLSPDELSAATAILTIPGAFINLGCVKAIRQKLRKVPKEVLVIILESMSVLRDSPFFVGMLRCEGISRTFYKCPPSVIKQEALDYYQLDYSIYKDLYNGPVKVPNNIKDPIDWITKTKMTSPFLEQQQF